MPNYAAGKIYALRHGEAVLYVGSTTRTLNARLARHRSRAKLFPGRKLYARMAEVGHENVRIELLSAFPCDSGAALLAEERRLVLAHGTHADGCNVQLPGGDRERFLKMKRAEGARYRARVRERRAAERATLASAPAGSDAQPQ